MQAATIFAANYQFMTQEHQTNTEEKKSNPQNSLHIIGYDGLRLAMNHNAYTLFFEKTGHLAPLA